jgi:uncharacterized protein DUF4349
MRFTTLLVLSVALLGLSGCERTAYRNSQPASLANVKEQNQRGESAPNPQSVSLNQADAANAAKQAAERKVIRNGVLAIEVASPTDNQSKIASIAESHQGFVVTTEYAQRTDDDRTKPETSVTLVVRVPQEHFDAALNEIRAIGVRVVQQKVTGQDVTEEFMDLEARVKSQKALETQFLEIMKRAGTVQDALNVQTALANVRTEIEKLEGRRRFLENQTSLSTINVTLQSPTAIVNASGFWYGVRSAFADGVSAAVAIILILIRIVVAMLPILILIVLPAALIVKLILKRRRGKRMSSVSAPKTEAGT